MINLLHQNIPQNLADSIFMIGILLLISIGLRNLCLSFWQGITYVKRLHQIPCSRCGFFTGDYHLKCTVSPNIALTENALNCSDYEPNDGLVKPILQPCELYSQYSDFPPRNRVNHN